MYLSERHVAVGVVLRVGRGDGVEVELRVLVTYEDYPPMVGC
ncbi:MAG: hypothetical protein RX317_07050 [bacterium]|nr:hypothetical protein [bacterium]